MKLSIISLFLLFTISLQAAVGDLFINYQTNSTGKLTELTWPRANSTIWGADSTGTIKSFSLGSGLLISGDTSLALDISYGGFGFADAGKIPVFAADGSLRSASFQVYSSGLTYPATFMYPASFALVQTGGKTLYLQAATLDTDHIITFPSKAGTVALTSDLVAGTVLDTLGTTRGSVIYRGASGWTVLTPGTSSYGLVSGGAGADPSYMPVAILTAINSFTPRQTFTAGLDLGSSATLIWNSDTTIGRDSAAVFQHGADAVGVDAVSQTIKAADTGSGSNRNGGSLTLASGNSTGTGTSAIIFSTPAAGTSGTAARTAAERARITSSGLQVGKLILWGNAAAAPTSAPPSGFFYLYVDPADGQLKTMSSSGATTTLVFP